MFTPLRHTIPGLESISGRDSANEVLLLQREEQSIQVDHDGFTIGSSSQCDLTIADLTASQLHAVIHIQSGAIWIESANDESLLLINDRPCRRMALRHDDRIRIGAVEVAVRLVARNVGIAEQSLVSDHDSGRRAGWDALLQAIEAAKNEVLEEEAKQQPVEKAELDDVQIEELLAQIQQLNQTLSNRTEEMHDREVEVLNSTEILEQHQRDVSHRLGEMLDQLNQSDPPNELRASA
jgi:predicted component of type VI protein secretion system